MGAGLQGTQSGILHYELGVPVDALTTRLSNGETLAQIAAEQGYTAEEFTALMTTARSQAIDQALASGELTQEQADWMKQRGASMGGGMRGTGGGRFANPDCPYVP